MKYNTNNIVKQLFALRDVLSFQFSEMHTLLEKIYAFNSLL